MVDYNLLDEILYSLLSKYSVADVMRSMKNNELMVMQWNVQPLKPLLNIWGSNMLKNVTVEGILLFMKSKRPDLYDVLSTREGRRWLKQNMSYLINNMLLTR